MNTKGKKKKKRIENERIERKIMKQRKLNKGQAGRVESV